MILRAEGKGWGGRGGFMQRKRVIFWNVLHIVVVYCARVRKILTQTTHHRLRRSATWEVTNEAK